MSLKLQMLAADVPAKDKNTRKKLLDLAPKKEYLDGRTQQCHKDECDINKIMARYEVNQTISHVNRFQGVYGDFSDFDFAEQTRRLAAGREIFDALPAEVRDEFRQSPQAFFDFVNHPDNQNDLLEKLPALAQPGDQLPREWTPTADRAAAVAAASEPFSETATPDPNTDAGA